MDNTYKDTLYRVFRAVENSKIPVVTIRDFAILMKVGEEEQSTGEVAKSLNIPIPSVSHRVAKMTKYGLLSNQPMLGDRTKRAITLTDKGASLLASAA